MSVFLDAKLQFTEHLLSTRFSNLSHALVDKVLAK